MTNTDFRTQSGRVVPRLRSRLKCPGNVRSVTLAALGPVALSVVLSACGGGASGEMPGRSGGSGGPGQVTASKAVIESPIYRSTAGLERQTEIVRSLTDAVVSLRGATTSGWQIRQDDTTGGGSELSGGVITFPKGTTPLEAVRQLVADHGDVFGLTDPLNQLTFARPIVDSTGIATVRANQSVRGVPVEGSSLLVTVRRVLTTPEIGFAKAHVYPDLDRVSPVDTRPAIDEQTAVGVATQRGAVPVGQGTLIITTPDSTPTLAWKFDADYTPPADAPRVPGAAKAGPLTVYVDARLGTVLRMQSGGSVALRAIGGSGLLSQNSPGVLKLPAKGTPVKVSGTVIGGFKVTMTLEKLPDGSIVFIDSSQPNADRETGTGLNVVFDGSQVTGDNDLPGDLARINSGEKIDPDTFTAAWAAKTVLDYYRVEHGRASWDGQGIPLISSVHLPEPYVTCNAYFSPDLKQMSYGGACREDGQVIIDSLVDISVVGHEITHGVTDTAAPWISSNSGQGASLNEGNSDYFGVIIQNQVFGKPYATEGVSMCIGREPNSSCHEFEPGVKGDRTVDSGALVDDGEFLLREPRGLVDLVTDQGGAHDNSMIWTNALWQIRRAFASGDGGDMLKSPAARRFDRIVYRAITTYFTNETDFAAAASAVTQAAVDLDASGPEQDVIRAQFLLSQFCAGCSTPAGTRTPVADSPQMELKPIVLDTGIAYIGQSHPSGSEYPLQKAYFAPFDSTKPAALLGPADEFTESMDGKGSWLVELRYNNDEGWYQLTNVATGKTEILGPWTRAATAAVSNDTVVWPGKKDKGFTISARKNTGGKVMTLTLDKLPTQLGVDGTVVAFQTEDGRIQVWDLQTNKVKVLDQIDAQMTNRRFSGFPGAVKVSGRTVAALGGRDGSGFPTYVTLYDVDKGSSEVLTNRAFPAGLSFDGNHLVWSEVTGRQPSALAALIGRSVAETELVIYSLQSKTGSYALKERGQQGFASIGGDRLAWQDSVRGGDDIYTATLPAGF